MNNEPTITSERERLLDEIVTAYLKAVEAGEHPEPKAWIERHPDLAAELSAFFAGQKQVAALAGNDTIGLEGGRGDGLLGRIRYFGDYELAAEISRGGMGVVYKAKQVSLNRIVALKMILRGELATSADVQRFRAEARAAATLDHPHIVPIFEVGEHEGQQYYSMKLIGPGKRRSELGIPEMVRVAALVARAVHHAHQRGILHRDLKPSNILFDEAGTPSVTDFGLAKRLEGDSGTTKSGAIVGTPSYMAPEQARAEKGLTTAVDVYSLGAVLYEWLTGKPPFRGDDVVTTLMMVASEDPTSPRFLNRLVDRDLESICLKCLHKEPGRRYESAAALADDLERWQRGEPTLAKPVGRSERLRKWVRRRPAAAALIAVSVLSLAALFAFEMYSSAQLHQQVLRAEKGEQDALLQQQRAETNARLAADNASREAEQRLRADRIADDAWSTQYVAHVNLMASDWDIANISRIHDTLNIYRPLTPLPGVQGKGERLSPAFVVERDGAGMRGRKEVRGWEWHYQERLCHRAIRSLTGHAGSIEKVVFSPDGTRLASCGVDGTVRIWDRAEGKVLRTLGAGGAGADVDANTKQKNPLNVRIAFSPNGARLASAAEGEVKIWDVDTGRQVLSLEGHYFQGVDAEDKKTKIPTIVSSVAFSPDGTRLASAGRDHTVKMWDAVTGKNLSTLKEKLVSCVAFSPDGKRLALAYSHGAVMLHDANTGVELRQFMDWRTGPGFQDVAFSPDGTRLASAGAHGHTVMVWKVPPSLAPPIDETPRGEELFALNGHRDEVTSVSFSPDGTQLVTGSRDRTIKLWDSADGQERGSFKGHTHSINSVAFSPDGLRLASASSDGTVKLWDAGAGKATDKFGMPTDGFVMVAFSPDGTRLASADLYGAVTLWDTLSRQPLRSLATSIGLRHLDFSPDGTRLATADISRIQIWDVGTGKELRTMDMETVDVAWSRDGKRLATAGQDKMVRLWDVGTGQQQRILKGHGDMVISVAFARDGTRLASVSSEGTVKLWNPDTGQELRTFEVGSWRVAFNSDWTRLAAAGENGSATLWDLSTGQEIRTFKGHTGDTFGMAFCPGQARLATASSDGTIKLWNTDTGQELRNLVGHTGIVYGLAFSPDGTRLASAGKDGSIILWDARPLTPEVTSEVEIVTLLHTLFARPLPKSAVRAAIKNQASLSAAQRQQALELVDRFQEETHDPGKYHTAAWPVLRHPHANVFMAQFALAQMEAACALAPKQDTFQSALGIAHYRLGRFQKEHYQQALAHLAKGAQDYPPTLAVLAMTQHQLGQAVQSQATLARLRKLLQFTHWGKDQESQAFLAEAEAPWQPLK